MYSFVCNEEGKLNGMELNRRVGNDIIAGPFFIVGDSEDGEFVSLSDEQIEKYTQEFGKVQEFTGERTLDTITEHRYTKYR